MREDIPSAGIGVSAVKPELVHAALDRAAALAMLREAVQIPSVSGDEREVAEYLADRMRSLGYTSVELQEVAPERPNVVARLDTGRPGPSVVLQGHMDTVPAYNFVDAYSARIEGGKVWGRGASDMKGPLVAAILAVVTAHRAFPYLGGSFIIAATVDEESEKRGAFGLIDSGLRADMGISVEPTGLRIAIAQKGCVSVRVTTRGKSAHGAQPEQGVNAIAKMAKVIAAIESAPQRVVELPAVGPVYSTFNVGVIQGGKMFFIVPDECHIWVDCRTLPGETQATAVQELAQIVAAVRAQDPEVDAEITVERQDWKWPRIIERGIGSCSVDIRHPVVRAVAEGYHQVTGRQPQYIVQNAWCETDFLVNDLGIPTVNFGPGQMELAHSTQEHIDIEQFFQGIEVLAVALGLLGHAGQLERSGA